MCSNSPLYLSDTAELSMRASPSVFKILALSLVLGLSACSSNKDKDILTEQEYYREARTALDKGNLIVAQGVNSRPKTVTPSIPAKTASPIA